MERRDYALSVYPIIMITLYASSLTLELLSSRHQLDIAKFQLQPPVNGALRIY